ncbi:MAG: hypothetical protein LBD48_00195 [Treponema sp.]|nr:hypothetical protein [Treponema sp.]
MTNKQKLPGLFGTALIAVLVLAGCPNPGGGGDDPHQPGGDALEGTWSRNSPTLGSLTLGFDGYGGLHMIIGTVGSASGSYVYNHPHLSIFLEGHPEAAKNGIVESVSSSTLILSGFTGNESDLNGTWQKKQSPGGGQ